MPPVQLHGIAIHDDTAEAFPAWAARLIITAANNTWLRYAVDACCGYGTSIIGCDVETGLEQILPSTPQTELPGIPAAELPKSELPGLPGVPGAIPGVPGAIPVAPDGRPGAVILFFNRDLDRLAAAVRNRIGQCVLTCPTTAVFDGMDQPARELGLADQIQRIDLGRYLSFFGDGYQEPAHIHGRRCWKTPVMEGIFLVEDAVGAVPAVAGGQFVICGRQPQPTLAAAQSAADAIAKLPYVITPFPGGVCRSGSKVGSRYQGVKASTNDAFCPTLRGWDSVATRLPPDATCAYEIVIDGLTPDAVAAAMRAGILAACASTGAQSIVAIAASEFAGRLGNIQFQLREILRDIDGFEAPHAPQKPSGQP